MRPRDAQKSKVYTWESRTFYDRRSEAGWPTLSLGECSALIGRVCVPAPRLADGRGKTRGSGGPSRISLPRHARYVEAVLHECAHTLTLRRQQVGYPIAYHGPEFVSQYIALLSRFAGYDREALTLSAHRAGLRMLWHDEQDAVQAAGAR